MSNCPPAGDLETVGSSVALDTSAQPNTQKMQMARKALYVKEQPPAGINSRKGRMGMENKFRPCISTVLELAGNSSIG
jgi:hypothetical protein